MGPVFYFIYDLWVALIKSIYFDLIVA